MLSSLTVNYRYPEGNLKVYNLTAFELTVDISVSNYSETISRTYISIKTIDGHKAFFARHI